MPLAGSGQPVTRFGPEVSELSQKLVAGALPLAHQVKDASGGPVGLRTVLADIMQSAPDIERSAHHIDIIRRIGLTHEPLPRCTSMASSWGIPGEIQGNSEVPQ
jgi:hypothetical protein